MDEGKLKEEVLSILAHGDNDDEVFSSDFIVSVNEAVQECAKEFPYNELQFFDARSTEEAEDFRKHVNDWFLKWFGE